MDNHDKNLLEMLSGTGTIGKLRQKIISLLLAVEETNASFENNSDEDSKHAQEVIAKLEFLLKEFTTSQKIADQTLVTLTPEKRRYLQKEAPELFEIFGWADKVTESGDLKEIL